MKNIPKILFFDIETSPNVVETWGLYEENALRVVKDWKLLCFAYKWQGGRVVAVGNIPQKKLVQKLWHLFDEADVVVAHNGDQFDVKKSTALFLRYGLKPPSPYKTIDTKKVAKRYFRFDSNKLDSLGRELGIGRKIHTGGYELWEGCLKGNKSAWKKMLSYNKQDVILLEKVYLKLRPYMANHPNWNAFLKEERCPSCRSWKTMRRGFNKTKRGKSQRFQCQECGAWFEAPSKA